VPSYRRLLQWIPDRAGGGAIELAYGQSPHTARAVEETIQYAVQVGMQRISPSCRLSSMQLCVEVEGSLLVGGRRAVERLARAEFEDLLEGGP
jgi:hypothetical protein